jgi:FkbM family methyltransferase
MRDVIDLIKEQNLKSMLDIGANLGSFSYVIKNYVPDLEIMMIEANPFCDGFLKRINIPYQIVCLSDSEREVNFFLEDKNFVGTGASYYLEKTQAYAGKNFTKMNTKKLDDVVSQTYDFIKIDTQGSELDIMKGGKKTIDAAKYVLIETSIIEYNENAPLKEEIVNYMSSIGFNLFKKIEDHYMENKLIQEDWIFSR